MLKILKPSLWTSSILMACILLAACGGESSSSGNNGASAGISDPIENDLDGDGILDAHDDFPNNPDQYLDLDGDGLGHTEDDDNDGDGILDVNDNCPYVANADQADSNGIDDVPNDPSGLGDACELSILNDTGQEDYGAFPSGYGACSDSIDDNLSTIQDCSYGRDQLAKDNKLVGELAKTGAGDSAFDFTKLDVSGIPLADQSGGISYCIKDNVTGLIWEKKISSNDASVDSQFDTYYWFDEDEAWNAGVIGTNTMPSNVGIEQPCAGYVKEDEATWCNTQAFIKRMNTANYCGANDWRLPSVDEITSIVDYGEADKTDQNNRVAIDQEYFSRTQNRNYWTRTNDARLPASAWSINMAYGALDTEPKARNWYVRLVRDNKQGAANE